MMIVENETVALRLMEAQDTDLIIKWRNTDSVRTHFIYQKPFTRQTHENWIKTMVETGKVDQFIICDKTNHFTPVGSVYIRDIDMTHKKAEYGIFIGEESARGKGIGTNAAKLMLEYCFENKMLHRVFLRVFADNEQAIRSYEKAGFLREALLKDDVCINGTYRDIVLMGIINPKEK